MAENGLVDGIVVDQFLNTSAPGILMHCSEYRAKFLTPPRFDGAEAG